MAETAHVIKKDAQANVTPATFEETAPTSAAHRIPAERTSMPEGDDAGKENKRQPIRGQVLRDGTTRQTVHPVTVEPEEFVADLPLDDDPSSERDATNEMEKEEASNEESGRTEAEWKEHLEDAVATARAEGYEEGREAGYEAGYEEAETTVRAECREQREALVDDASRLDDLWTHYVEEREPMLVELALELAEAIVDAPFAESMRQASEEALTEAIAELDTVPPVTVTVHPSDYQRLQDSGLADRMEATTEELHWESDPDRAKGDWSVTSPAGAIRRLRSEIVETLRAHLELPPASSPPERA